MTSVPRDYTFWKRFATAVRQDEHRKEASSAASSRRERDLEVQYVIFLSPIIMSKMLTTIDPIGLINKPVKSAVSAAASSSLGLAWCLSLQSSY
jgi:hypothetical protein